MLVLLARASSAGRSSSETFEASAFSAKARYIAPVSRLRRPKYRARWRAIVLLPAPAGPSMAMIGRRALGVFSKGVRSATEFIRSESSLIRAVWTQPDEPISNAIWLPNEQPSSQPVWEPASPVRRSCTAWLHWLQACGLGCRPKLADPR